MLHEMPKPKLSSRSTKVKEITHFRKVTKFFQCAERGSHSDERAILKILNSSDSKMLSSQGNGFYSNREDITHIINTKNLFGQTALYVACKNGNLNIVKLLITQGCNPFISSSIDKQNLESNLQVAARWCHFEIVRYLLENSSDFNPGLADGHWWTREELRDCYFHTEGISKQIRNLIKENYREIYRTSIDCADCCIFLSRLASCFR
jgi:ankyrin repeat protein